MEISETPAVMTWVQMDQPEDYQYDKIATSDTIRLLRIDGERGGIIVGHLLTTTLADAPDYFALSYCWGTHIKQGTIICDGKKLSIVVNVAQALRQLNALARKSAAWDLSTKWFWIDQICINQQDRGETLKQVKLMRDIYTRSIRTLVWMGTLQEFSCQVWPLVDQIYEVCRRETPDAKFMGHIKSRMYSDEYHYDTGLPDWDDPVWNHFRALLRVRWVTRAWVIQEVAMSREDPLILHGDHVYPWSRLGWAATWLRRVGYVREKKVPVEVLNIDTISNMRRSKEPWRLPALLAATALKFHSTMPQDKVFSLLGLAAETQDVHSWPEELQPDYTRSPAQVFRDVSRFLIMRYQSLAIFAFVTPQLDKDCIPAGETAGIEVESWVANWRLGGGHSLTRSLSWLGYSNYGGPTTYGFLDHYKATGNLLATVIPSNDPGILGLGGLKVDTVAATTDVGTSMTLPTGSHDGLAHILHELIHMVQKTPTASVTELVAALLAGLRGPLLRQAWTLACQHGKFDSQTELVAAFIKVTTVAQHALAGSTEQELCADGTAYIKQRLETAATKLTESSALRVEGEAESQPLLDKTGATVEMRPADTDKVQGSPDHYSRTARNFCFNRRFFVTEDGRLGLGPRWIVPGDFLCVLFGGGVPYVVRQKEDKYRLIGEAFVNGLIDGEALELLDNGKVEREVFSLV